MKTLIAALCSTLLFHISLFAEETPSAELAPATEEALQQEINPIGDWSGRIDLGSMALTLVLHIDSALSATLDCPEQALFGAPVEEFAFDGTSLSFAQKQWMLSFKGSFDPALEQLSGKVQQKKLSVPLVLKRCAAAPLEKHRPQTPKAPFPYRVEEVIYPNKRAQAILSATLTLPKGPGPFPAVLLIAGSGPTDRDDTFFGHKRMLVLADHLTRQGFAVLRQDKRGVGQSTGDYRSATTSSFADDALLAVRYLKGRSEIDPLRIGLIGHNEGAVIAPMAASQSDDVAFLVLLGAPAVNGEEILCEQAALLQRAGGASEEAIAADLELRRQLISAMKQSSDFEEGKQQWKGLVAHRFEQTSNSGWEIDREHVEQLLEYFDSNWPWYRHFVSFEPTSSLRQVHVPTLAIYGELDLQISPKQNLALLAKALEDADNDDAKIVVLPQLNHLMQTCSTGSIAEYPEIEETIAPAALDLIASWLKEQTAVNQHGLIQDQCMTGLSSLHLVHPNRTPARPVAPAVPEIPLEELFGNPERSSPRLSPDGTKLAYLAPDSRGVLNVWVGDISKEEPGELITSDQKRGISSFLWDYDGKHILYLQDIDGDENDHLYQTNLESKVTRDLTPFIGAKARVLQYVPEHPGEMLVELNHRNPECFDIYHLDLETGALELAVQNEHRAHQWLADSKLRVRASQAWDEAGNMLIRVRKTPDSNWETIYSYGPDEVGAFVSVTPENDAIYMISSLGSNTARLMKLSIQDGSIEEVAKDPLYDLPFSYERMQSTVLMHPKTHALQAIGVQREKLEWIVLDPSLQEEWVMLQRPNEEMQVISRDGSDRHWVLSRSSDTHPTHYSLYDRDAKMERFLFSACFALERYPLNPMQPISFSARDGMKLHGYLTLPNKQGPMPAVLLVHGGPWVRDSWGFRPFVQWLSNRGYAVLQVNYRGSTGYGKEYLNAGNREWAGKMHTDLLDGKQWLIDQQIADPSRTAIVGGSYGGYATLVGLSFTPEEFVCGIDIVGPSNLNTLRSTMPSYWSFEKMLFDLRVGVDPEFLAARSPLFKADQICRPLLIAQGANDPRVKQAESDQIVEAMRSNGQEVEYFLFTDEGHGFVCPENRIRFFAEAERFLRKHLEGKE